MRVALVDGGSFVLPYDHQLAQTLAAEGIEVEFHGSRTRYNGELLEAMRRLPGVTVHDRALSGTVAPRWQGALGYLALWLDLWRRRHRFDAVNLQFSAGWPLELPFLWALRQRLVFTVHNAVPHGFAGRRHRPTERIARLARTLVFVSRFSRDDFIARYGESFRAKSRLLGIGLTPVVPGLAPVPYRPAPPPEALVYWSTVKPYKGVELFADLARSKRLRDAGVGLEIRGAWAPELAALKAELAGLGVRIEDAFLDSARAAEAARAQRRLHPALPRGDAVGRPVLAPAPRPRLPLHRRRRPGRLPAPLRPAGPAAAGAQRRCRRRCPRAPATRPGGRCRRPAGGPGRLRLGNDERRHRRRLRRRRLGPVDRPRGPGGRMPQSRGSAGPARPGASPAVLHGPQGPEPPNCP